MNTTIDNDQEVYMDKSDPGVFESGVATLDTFGTPRNTSGTVVGTLAGYGIGCLPFTSTAYYWCLILLRQWIKYVMFLTKEQVRILYGSVSCKLQC
jgi:hypothetical protein